MAPPLPSSSLDANPAFAKLWKHVTTEVLDQDGVRKSVRQTRGRVVTASGTHTVKAEDGSGYEDPEEEEVVTTSKFKQKKTKTFEEELHEVRVRRIKRQILRSIIADVAYHFDDVERENDVQTQAQGQSRIPLPARKPSRIPGMEEEGGGHAVSAAGTETVDKQKIPSDLRDLLVLISAYVELDSERNSQIYADDEGEDSILADDIANFKAKLPIIASAIETRLVQLESSLTGLASLTTTDDDSEPQSRARSQRKGQPVSLEETLTPQTNHLTHLRSTALPSSLLRLTSTAQGLLRWQSQLLQSSLLQLESSKYGALWRHELSRAGFLAQVAVTMDLKTRVLVLEGEARRHDDGEETRKWIRARMEKMNGEEREVGARLEELSGLLEEYEAVDPGLGVMKRLGARYRENEREMEEVRKDIQRLKQGEKA